MSTDVLHPRIQEVIAVLRDAQQETDALCATLTAVHESRRMGDGWSVAEVVEHIAIVEDGAGRIVNNIAKQVVGVAETSRDPVVPPFARYHVADPSVHKVMAPDVVRPRGGVPVAESLARIHSSRARLMAALEQASGTALGSAHFPHPLFGPLDGYQWALMAAQHQLRHLAQIRSILSA